LESGLVCGWAQNACERRLQKKKICAAYSLGSYTADISAMTSLSKRSFDDAPGTEFYEVKERGKLSFYFMISEPWFFIPELSVERPLGDGIAPPGEKYSIFPTSPAGLIGP